MTSSQRKILIYGLVVIMLSCAIALAFTGVDGMAYAATSYTGVFEDLSKDASFESDAYPAYPDNTTMEIVQIAESAEGELFLYIYQPAAIWQPLTATSISMALSEVEPSFWIYWLKLVSREGVFAKYVVEDFKVSTRSRRIYNISELWRPWDADIDSASGNDNTIDQVAYPVQQLWTAVSTGSDVIYTMETVDVVTITHQWAGECSYVDGVSGDAVVGEYERTHTDLHFVAFSANYDISKLYEAEVSYVSRDVQYSYSIFKDYKYNYIYGEYSDPQYVTLSSEDETMQNPTHGIFGHKHSWTTIRTVSEFIETEELTSEAISKLQKDQWVLTFTSTPVYTRYHAADVDYDRKITEISEVAILRLKFECDGKTYNLGVVSNKVTSDHNPDTISPLDQIKEDFLSRLRKAWDIIKPILIALASVAGAILIIWVIMQLVQAFKQTKIVINQPQPKRAKPAKKKKSKKSK